MTMDVQREALIDLFGGSVNMFDPFSFEVSNSSKDIPALPTLMKVCEIMGCRPEELYFNLDEDGMCSESSGCSIRGTLNFTVRR